MTDIVHIANILVTRRCNLACSYCNIVKNYKGMPEEYKRMNQYSDSELTGEQWIDIFDRLAKNNPNVFFIIYGGEPMAYEDLWKIIKHCNENNYYYTVISNNTDYVQDKIREIYEKCGKYRGFTSSVDPVVDADSQGQIEFSSSEKGKFFITEKSNYGLNRLIEMKKNDWVDDAVAEITVMKSTIKYLYNTVKKLSENGIYSSITTLDDQKTNYYDFAKVSDMSEMVPKGEEILEEFNKIKADKNLLIHMPELLDELYEILPSNGDCEIEKSVHNVTVDSDGTFRLCLRIRGVMTSKLSYDTVINENGKFTNLLKSALTSDKEKYCKGCNWTCSTIMTKKFQNQIIDHGPQNR